MNAFRFYRFWVVIAGALALLGHARESLARAPAGRYTVANGTVYDAKTKLTWQQVASTSTFTWGSSTVVGTAQNYCATLNLDGTGWRLPTVKELGSLIGYSVSGAEIDPTFAGSNTYYWSSTGLTGSPLFAWMVYAGATTTWSVADPHPARCVR